MKRDKQSGLAKLGRWARYHLIRALRENASPGRTALGLGLGAFIGVFPSFLIGTPVAFFLAGKLGLNRAAAIAGAVVSMNPLTAPFLYTLSAWLGFELLNKSVEAEAQSLLTYLREYSVPFLLGNTLVALSIAILFAGLMFFYIRRSGTVAIRALLIRPKRFRPLPARDAESSSTEATPVR